MFSCPSNPDVQPIKWKLRVKGRLRSLIFLRSVFFWESSCIAKFKIGILNELHFIFVLKNYSNILSMKRNGGWIKIKDGFFPSRTLMSIFFYKLIKDILEQRFHKILVFWIVTIPLFYFSLANTVYKIFYPKTRVFFTHWQ